MDITVTLTIPDYVFSFYQKVAAQMPDHTVQEVMAQALYGYAGIVAEELQTNRE